MAPGIEFKDLDWIAIVAAMASNIVIGFLWYSQMSPTGRIWIREMKFPPNHKPSAAEMTRAMILMVIGTFLLMFVLQHVFLAFRDAIRLDTLDLDRGISYGDGAMGAFFTWLGFYVPVYLGAVGWEGKPWSLFFVNTGYYLVSLMAAGMIFAALL